MSGETEEERILERLRNAGDKMRELSIRKHGKLKSYRSRCMHPDGNCNRKGDWAHTVQNKGPLDLLVEHGRVLAPDKEVAKNILEEPRIDLQDAGRNSATAFRGLCGQHDKELFDPIDVSGSQTLDYENDKQMFLLAYRASMKNAFDHDRGVRWQEFGASTAEQLGLVPRKNINPLRIQAQQFKAIARKTERFKRRLDKEYLASNYGVLGHEIIQVDGSGARVAASGAFSDREADGEPAFLVVNLVPETNRHVLVLSFLEEHRGVHAPYLDLFRSKFGRGLRKLTSRLLMLRLRSFVVNPVVWRTFPSLQQEEIRKSLSQPVFPGDLVQVPNSRINLFEAVV